MSEGERRRARHRHGRVMIALLATEAVCRLLKNSMQGHGKSISSLRHSLNRSVCVCAHEGMWTRKSPKDTHAQIGQDISAQRDVQKNAHRSVEGFKYGMSRCSPGPKWKAAYLWN